MPVGVILGSRAISRDFSFDDSLFTRRGVVVAGFPLDLKPPGRTTAEANLGPHVRRQHAGRSLTMGTRRASSCEAAAAGKSARRREFSQQASQPKARRASPVPAGGGRIEAMQRRAAAHPLLDRR